jgi:predicted O-methyltransferase YrrM
MLVRVNNFLDWFGISDQEREKLERLAEEAASLADGMTHLKDYFALGAIALATQPKSIFEIGTYLGVTSNFFLKLLPNVKVVSIAFINPPRLFARTRFNNSELKKSQVGSAVEAQYRSRFVQLFGDSHKLSDEDLLNRFSPFDFIFIDGDHSLEGVNLDTNLADSILASEGTICWHDANPKPRYLGVRDHLEGMSRIALATMDNYVGGIACWSEAIENKLK